MPVWFMVMPVSFMVLQVSFMVTRMGWLRWTCVTELATAVYAAVQPVVRC